MKNQAFSNTTAFRLVNPYLRSKQLLPCALRVKIHYLEQLTNMSFQETLDSTPNNLCVFQDPQLSPILTGTTKQLLEIHFTHTIKTTTCRCYSMSLATCGHFRTILQVLQSVSCVMGTLGGSLPEGKAVGACSLLLSRILPSSELLRGVKWF